jgi:OOP family OmpA-OmpF porin
MKKTLLSLALCSTALIQAQDFNRSSFGLSIGGHDGMHNTLHTTRIYSFSHYEANYRYMLNNRVGLKFDVGFDNFKFKDQHPPTQALRFSIQPIFNLTDILHFDDFSKRLGLQLHVGGGYATMWNKTLLSGPAQLFQAQEGAVDEMLQGIIGLTPQFKVTERLSINADISFMANIRQNKGFDFEALPIQGGGFTGYYASATIGFNYYLGKAKTHADWTYTPRLQAADLAKITELQKQVQALQTQMQNIDTVVERYETRVEVFQGQTDTVYIDDYKTLEDAGVYEVLFVKGSFWLNPVYHQSLNNLVTYMNTNPSIKIGVVGHADTDGENDLNNKLSAARAEAVTTYLVSNGVAKERLVVSYKGKSETKYPGKTLEVDAANRRVSFWIIRID